MNTKSTGLTSDDVEKIRRQFPILDRKINNHPLVYFDNGATTLKPTSVVSRIAHHYLMETSNVHRGIHTLSGEATTMFEQAREAVRGFLNAPSVDNIVFTRGTTDGINLIAKGLVPAKLAHEGDEILITELEHHSNIVPWQMAAEQYGLKIKVARILDSGELDIESFKSQLNERTRLVAIASVSNTLGTRLPVKELIALAKAHNALVLVDAAQSVAHEAVDVADWNCDFLVFSGHKLFGPTGIGVLYGRGEILDQLPPVQGGGSMIKNVTFEKTTYDIPPQRFEGGTPHIAGAIGLGEAIRWVSQVGLANIAAHENALLERATRVVSEISGLRIFGTAAKKGPILSFNLDGIHPHDVGTLLDQEGIAVRTGHHCTQPLMQKFKIPGTVRASFAVYNTLQEVERFGLALEKARRILA
jgi:cysteine desulfurase/selenocysteine lyase